ncbi:Transmembrane protein 131 [Nymphon striatum]|nr:Transmembrane protein 131 [Nymphon striatum]
MGKTVPGTRSYHHYTPISTTEISYKRTSEHEFEQHFNLSKAVQVINDDAPLPNLNDFVACRYDTFWWVGIVDEIEAEKKDFKIKFMHPHGPSKRFSWPERDDSCWVSINNMIAVIGVPTTRSGRIYEIDIDDFNKVNVISTPVNDALKIEFKSIKILPDTFHPSEVAQLTFIPSKVVNPKQCSGKIVIKSKNNQFKLSVPYMVQLLHGSLHYNRTSLQFFISPSHTTFSRVLNITNFYNATIVFFSYSLFDDAQPYFKVLNFKRVILKSGQSHQILKLKFSTDKTDLQLSTFIRLHSNVSYFDIPLVCYTGKLKQIISQTSKNQELEFGTLGMGEKRSMMFKLQNQNQVKVVIQSWNDNNMTRTMVKCIGIQKNSSTYTNFTKGNKMSYFLQSCNCLKLILQIALEPFDTAIFQMEVTAPSDEGKYFGIALIQTIYEGKISSQPLYIHSTFSQSLKIVSVKASADSRFYYHSTKASPSILKPETKSNIGKLFFDPKKLCKNNCYAAFPTNTPGNIADFGREVESSLIYQVNNNPAFNVNLQVCHHTSQD